MNKISIITVTRNRVEPLTTKALASLQQQTSPNFEWIVINDGGDTATKELIESVKPNLNFHCIYQEMPHTEDGFALCHGRNLGIELAQNEFVTYLDDDNAIHPDFVAEMTAFISADTNIKLAIPLQERSRQVWQDDRVVVRSQTFISPSHKCNLKDLVTHRELLDSNGLTHTVADAPSWNPQYRIYCDYEYFLQCLGFWGSNCFRLLSKPLVEYVQSNQGIIGQSGYESWASELKQIAATSDKYPILKGNPQYISAISSLADQYYKKHCSGLNIPAFSKRIAYDY